MCIRLITPVPGLDAHATLGLDGDAYINAEEVWSPNPAHWMMTQETSLSVS